TLGFFPGSGYFDGRFSNGPVYAELLADALGLEPLTRSGAGGDNFAFGGAETAGPGGFTGLFINGLDEQVDEFIASRDPDPEALHVVWAGANDLLNGQTDMAVPVGNIAGEITRLYDNGARDFLVLNLPDLGATPRFNSDASQSATFSTRTDDFNAQLGSTLDVLEGSLPGADFTQFDVDGVFDELLTDPASLGLTNITDQALGDPAVNANEYLFWDDVHPTATVHAMLAEQIAVELLVVAGDFNGDGLVTAADYPALRDAGDASADYDAWAAGFMNGATVVASATEIPEPCSLTLAAVLIGVFVAAGRSTDAAAAGRATRG
ncbi:MAG: SGNH/GDSL hydrolase family protein, partial [Planctomycetota bacterium]